MSITFVPVGPVISKSFKFLKNSYELLSSKDFLIVTDNTSNFVLKNVPANDGN